MNETRPEPLKIFASGSSNINSPSESKQTSGYSVKSELPSSEHNYLLNKITNMINYLEQGGIPLYHQDIKYFKDARVRGSNGDIYKSKDNENINNSPVLDTNEDYWHNESKYNRESNKAGMPIGTIVMWSGSIDDIPTDWLLCDGNNDTPDLRGKFIYGASENDDVNVTGGSADAVVVKHNHTANHGHTGNTNSAGSHYHSLSLKRDGAAGGDGTPEMYDGRWGSPSHTFHTSTAGIHSHTVNIEDADVTTSDKGEDGTNKNLPPFIKLAYIIKVA
jgi:microcystin-dependent protein